MKFIILTAFLFTFASAEVCDEFYSDLKHFEDNLCQDALPKLTIATTSGENVASCGELLDKTKFTEMPKVSFPDAKEDKKYCLFMLDPDAPDHDPGFYFLHMIASNITGSDFIKGDFSHAVFHPEYRKPSPPEGTGDHRYQFYAFCQSGESETDNTIERRKYNFLKKLNSVFTEETKESCKPVASMEFKAHF